ncbi:hypothetical protein YK56LOC_33370 [Caballeronia sp. HLA56]
MTSSVFDLVNAGASVLSAVLGQSSFGNANEVSIENFDGFGLKRIVAWPLRKQGAAVNLVAPHTHAYSEK